MQRSSDKNFLKSILVFLSLILLITTVFAGSPLWTFEPLTPTKITVPTNSTTTIQYRITNQSSKPHILVVQPIQAMTQITSGVGICRDPFVLAGKSSCVLSLQINGSQLNSPIIDGPVVCQQGSALQCYRPSQADILHVTQTQP